MSTESVSSDSPLQAAQLIEDQLSEDELETVVGGVLNELHYSTNKFNKPPLHATGGNTFIAIFADFANATGGNTFIPNFPGAPGGNWAPINPPGEGGCRPRG